ncbi:MAG: glutamate synthase, partial [Clostridia bacterium]|nr:glutamate synthase [Clostridia bacterium]
MIKLNALNLNFDQLNEAVRNSKEDIEISDCLGQRFIGAGLSDKNLTIYGTPGNALGAYLNGST